MNAEVVIYGASGYTGKLIAWKLAERGIPFIAAGRNLQRLEEQMKQVPELDGADYECVAVANTEEELTALFQGKKVVYNVVGPFMQYGHPVVQACLNAGCHYLDTTGEQDWVIAIKNEFAQGFADQELLLAPACSWMWTAGLLAAEICLETPGVDSLDIVYCPNGAPSVASTMSFIRMCCQPQYFLENNELIEWPAATSYDVALPGMHQLLKALPWSGGVEPVWYQQDERVRNCSVLTSFTNQAVMNWVLDKMKEFDEKYKDASTEEQENVTNEWGVGLTTEEPARDIPEVHRTTISCYGRGNTEVVRTTFWGTCGYTQTGALAAIAVKRILDGNLQASGFVSPAIAFGARNLIHDLAEEGLHCTVDKAN